MAVRLLLSALCVCALSGCSMAYSYHLRGTVKDAATGKTLNRVQVELVDVNDVSYKDWVTGVWTDSYGYFRMQFSVDRYDRNETRKWKLKLSAEGYQTEVIEIGPVDKPSSGDPVYLVLRAFLRPADNAE